MQDAPEGMTHEHQGSGSPTSGGMLLLERIVALVKDKNGSDIHLMEGERPRVRIQGDLLPIESKDHPVVTRRDIEEIMEFALAQDQLDEFRKHADSDFSMDFEDATGRINVGFANGRRYYLVMRYLRANLIPIDKIGVDADMLKKLIATESGLIIVAGETSSGKTTTIAAMLDYINHNRLGSITTIENPVEYTIHSDKCLVTRREIGRDTPDFAHALRASVRKNPDVLLIGEVRDQETATIALNAAETGIMSFCTLHAIGAIPAISRLQHIVLGAGAASGGEGEFHARLATTLRGIISQQLLKAVDGSGVFPIYEILNITYAEKNYLRQSDFGRLEQSLETDRNISMGNCVYRLWHQKPRRINEDTIRRLYGDQYNLMMNRLNDLSGWKPLAAAMG
ncbi:MAG: Flp pilus assembly complex ATPase component TadA [Candidatus Sumerlaeaceae bacterium]|nr:Flp pilus assembly complex ATPase component TadA [Candidatus Sumerlaeaceae bacterium]